jgi:hypothetical protein
MTHHPFPLIICLQKGSVNQAFRGFSQENPTKNRPFGNIYYLIGSLFYYKM